MPPFSYKREKIRDRRHCNPIWQSKEEPYPKFLRAVKNRWYYIHVHQCSVLEISRFLPVCDERSKHQLSWQKNVYILYIRVGFTFTVLSDSEIFKRYVHNNIQILAASCNLHLEKDCCSINIIFSTIQG